ncbi:MAG: hypothetical protein P4L86_27280 [Mycobacterium sp.]|nr:hypothetical protein [Mycobacterium sp.]
MTGRAGPAAAMTVLAVLGTTGCSVTLRTANPVAAPSPAVQATRPAPLSFAVGDCVAVPPAAPANAPELVEAVRASCAADPSYTIGALANSAGACPSREYQHLPSTLAEPSTARLCLVPNLVADHCYTLEVPVGVVQLADCADRHRPGLLVQVTQRFEVRDDRACPTAVGAFAWPYPSPARTYCTRTIY